MPQTTRSDESAGNAQPPEWELVWVWKEFHHLTSHEVYEMLRFRQEVFVVEQNCPFAEIDGRDRNAWHLFGVSATGECVGYLRLLPPEVGGNGLSLGRVIVRQAARRAGLGRQLMQEGLRRAREAYPGHAIRLFAQQHLEPFYAALGFQTDGPMYLEDGIPHVPMLCPPEGGT
ncbi:MAG: GNAT family N-acetyltransferase [Planctomycetales bacterium]